MKISEFFEKHVQWIALGLAGLWLLYVGWTCGVHRPEVDVNGSKLSAGSVDEYIRDNDANALANKMNDGSIPAGLVDVPDFTDAFVNAMNGQNTPPLTSVVVNSPPPYLEVVIKTQDPNKRQIKGSVHELPEVTTPTDVIAVA